MDAHYDLVMRERTAAADAPDRLYFAYSTALDRPAFEEWRAQHGYGFFSLPPGRVASALDVDLTYDCPSRWWGGRVAGLVDAPGARVWGLLFTIRGVDWPVVRHKEGGVTGLCDERPVRVEVDGSVVEATAFSTAPGRRRTDGPVSARFVEALVRGARDAALPAAYVDGLAARAR